MYNGSMQQSAIHKTKKRKVIMGLHPDNIAGTFQLTCLYHKLLSFAFFRLRLETDFEEPLCSSALRVNIDCSQGEFKWKASEFWQLVLRFLYWRKYNALGPPTVYFVASFWWVLTCKTLKLLSEFWNVITSFCVMVFMW